jgi:endonuclease III
MTSIEIEIRRYLKNWFIEYGTKITKEEDIFCNSCPLNGFKIIKSLKIFL